MDALINWLLTQSPVIVIMGVVIYWLAKRLEKAEDDKDALSKDVVKLTTLWEEKSSKEGDSNVEIIKLLNDIINRLSK